MAQNTNQNNPQQQRDFNDAINDYRSLLRSISDELGKQRTHVADANAEYRKLDSIARQLQNTEEGISGLTSEQLNKLRGKYQMSVKEIKNQAQQLLNQKGIVYLTQTQLNYQKEKGKLDDKSAALLQGYLDDLKLEKSFLETIEQTTKKRLEYEGKVKDLTGATGAALAGMKGSMEALGLSSMSNYLNIDAAKKAMEEEADAIARGEKEGGALQVRMAGIKTLAEGLNKALFSAEAIIGFIVGQLAEGSQNMADFRKQTGMNYESAYAMNVEMKGIALGANDTFITSEKLGKSFAMMTEHLGMSADILGGTALVSATNLEQRLGMSADNAAQLTTYTRLQGKDTETILSNSVATVGAFNKQNKTAINAREVLNDVAGASKSMYLNMGKNVTAMAAAATKARALGLSLAQAEKISESLLHFEDSIGKELEANLLLGGGVNLAKAREYALTGDTAKLLDEVSKQESIRNAFATKNVIAQQAAADAIGISKEELAGMALAQDLATLSAEDFKERYGETTYESMKARSSTEKLADAMSKITDILGSVVQLFTPLLDFLVFLATNSITSTIIAGVVAFVALAKAIGLAKLAYGGLTGLFQKGGLASAAGSLKDKLLGGGADKAKEAAEKAGTAKDKVAGKASGTGFKDSMKNLAEGFKEMGAGGVGKGIFNTAMAGPALLLAVPSIPFLLFMGKVELKILEENFTALANGLKSMDGTLMGSVALGVFGIAGIPAIASIPFLLFMGKVELTTLEENFTALANGLKSMDGTMIGSVALGVFGIAGIPAIASMPFLLFMGKIELTTLEENFTALANGLKSMNGTIIGSVALGVFGIAAALAIPSLIFLGGIALIGEAAMVGLEALGLGLASLGAVAATGLPFLAIGLIGALGLAMIPFGIALGQAAPAIAAFGTVVTSVFAGIATLIPVIVDGFVTLISSLAGSLGPMLLLGPALFGIAAGLGAVALAGLIALPAIGGLVALSLAAPALVSLGIGGGESKSAGEARGKSEEGSTAALEKKLDVLIAAVKAGGNVYMDSNKVGRAQVLGSFKSA